MAKTLKDQTKKEKIKKYLRWNLYLFILVFILSILLMLEEHEAKTIHNPLVEAVENDCNNAKQILNNSFIEGNRYNLIKSNLKDGKYTCSVLDATAKPNNDIDYELFNFSGDIN